MYCREVASERNKFRMEGGKEYSENAMKGAKDTANNLDCSVTPLPQFAILALRSVEIIKELN